MKFDPTQIPVEFVRRSRDTAIAVTSGHAVIFDGTQGNLVKSAGSAPVLSNDTTVLRTTDTFATNKLTLSRSYLAGLQLSNNGSTPNTAIDVSAGQARDDTNAANIVFSAAKTIDCTTTGANGLDAGSLANTTWYHVFAIAKADGTVAALASTSVSSPTLPSGYTYQRRIGSFKTDGSAHIIAFSQVGDEFIWAAVAGDLNTSTLSTVATLVALTVPTGVVVIALYRANSASNIVLINSPSENSVAVNATAGNISLEVGGAADFRTRTNTSAQVRVVAGAGSTTLQIATYGWLDRRGKDD